MARNLVLLGAVVLALLVLWGCKGERKKAVPVVLISIDGLKPEYVLEADARGLTVPNLRRFVREGAYASGVHGVIPTVTYPSHVTLVTGASPAVHGIHANTTFDPLGKNQGGWYWYAEDIRVPTLWDLARDAHLTTANVHWPVTVAARIDWSLPQYWRTGTPDDRKLLRVMATPGLLEELEKELVPYADGIDESITGDENRAKFAARLIERKHADFTLVYLTALDHAQHQTGPFSTESKATLERIDKAVGLVLDAGQRAYGGRLVVSVVSDHGFARMEKALQLRVAFRQAGLIEFDAKEKITGWKGMIWASGGSAAVVLKDPGDKVTRAKVDDLLAKLAADSNHGIARVVQEQELHRRGGFPEAQWLVAMKPGFVVGESTSGPLVTPASGGAHGYWPDFREMNSSFFVMGPGVTGGKALGTIDMRSIGPTLAGFLGVRLPAAEEPALAVQ
jgi:type I phosphodiesterase/nucleotide pyrophosphatase